MTVGLIFYKYIVSKILLSYDIQTEKTPYLLKHNEKLSVTARFNLEN